MKLFGYFRSSTSYRLRIALNLKGLAYDYVPVNLLKGEQKDPAFVARDPFASIPLLEADGRDRAQSMAQLEWLDEAYPAPPLLPKDIEARFTVRELAYAIATETHAPNNLQVLNYLKAEFAATPEQVEAWYRHWLARTLGPAETRLAQHG
ncbi:MAG: glutathione S-transferase N-terminal domain-containing protein, partial [Qipengyuania sp.]|nr:glutathione S-transferase N-terminal domain-containing protein [Qipengyuania sp.]